MGEPCSRQGANFCSSRNCFFRPGRLTEPQRRAGRGPGPRSWSDRVAEKRKRNKKKEGNGRGQVGTFPTGMRDRERRR